MYRAVSVCPAEKKTFAKLSGDAMAEASLFSVGAGILRLIIQVRLMKSDALPSLQMGRRPTVLYSNQVPNQFVEQSVLVTIIFEAYIQHTGGTV